MKAPKRHPKSSKTSKPRDQKMNPKIIICWTNFGPILGAILGPKWAPKLVQNWFFFGVRFWNPLFCLLERSWSRSGPKQINLERLLAAPRGIPREVSAILGVKRLPKGCPKGAQNEVQKRLELKMAKSQKSTTVHRICLIFEVPGFPFAAKSGSKTGSES